MSHAQEIAHRIRLARARRGLQQRELAAQLGVSPSSVGHWEAGTRQIRATQLARLATVLGTTADWIIGADGAPAAYLCPRCEGRGVITE